MKKLVTSGGIVFEITTYRDGKFVYGTVRMLP